MRNCRASRCPNPSPRRNRSRMIKTRRMSRSVRGVSCFVTLAALAGALFSDQEPLRPEWCRQLPRAAYKTLERIDVASDWFEVYRIRPGVFAIYEPHQYEEVICYLVLGQRRALLIDSGMGIGKVRE